MSYVPKRGDLIWLTFQPQAGHEQSGRRPAIVVSPTDYDDRVGLALVCPITKHAKGYPFEIELPKVTGVSGVVLADQLKSLDWRARDAKYIGKMPSNAMSEVLDRIRVLIEDDV